MSLLDRLVGRLTKTQSEDDCCGVEIEDVDTDETD